MTGKAGSGLREGFTTGTAAAAAAKAAVLVLAGEPVPALVDTPLPQVGDTRGRLNVPVARVEREGDAARGPIIRAVVVKDAGDDPDATHLAEIHAVVRLIPSAPGLPVGPEPTVMVRGGRGVGRVTLPGLPVAPGGAAINPEPREQIETAVREAAQGLDRPVTALGVTIEVPEGEALARRTMNPRLGIVGGISILGRTGIVRPYSHDAFLASVEQGLDVARATGLDTVVLATGRKSERLWLEANPGFPELGVVQAADLFAEATRAAAGRGFQRIGWALFFGKLVKQAQGEPSTHAHEADLDFASLARLCADQGALPDMVRDVARANTARQALDLLALDPAKQAVAAELVRLAQGHARDFAGTDAEIFHAVFDFSDSRLY